MQVLPSALHFLQSPARTGWRLGFATAPERNLFLAVAAVSLWLTAAMPVFAQESYYWTYSQHPALSYFDHPPMVAWLIGVGSRIFGDGAIGIRLGMWLCGCVTLIAGLQLLSAFGADARARLLWLLFAGSTPILVMTRFLANPDPPLLCAWTVTLAALWRARGGGIGWWLVAGVAAGTALLSKYTAVFLAVGGLLVLVFDPRMRRQWRRPGPYVGVAAAALTFAPVVAWNVAHDFESFRFQTEGRWQHAHLGFRWLTQFLGGQLLVLNPVLAVLLPASVVWLWRRRRADMRSIWLLAFGMPLPAFLLLDSLFVQVKINWLAPAAIPLLLGAAMWWSDRFARIHAVAARRLLRTALSVAVLAPAAPLATLAPQHRGTSWTGWDQIAESAERWEAAIDEADGIEGNVFFFAGDYRDAAQLTRNLKIHAAVAEPGEVLEPTLAQNVIGRPALQFDHWDSPNHHLGQDAVFVLPRPDQRDSLLRLVQARFRSVERVEHLRIERLGLLVGVADVFVCRGYLGPAPIAEAQPGR